MPHQDTSPEVVTVSIVRPMNDHGAIVAEVVETGELRHLVTYDSAALEARLSALPRTTSLSLHLEQLPARGNCWQVLGIEPLSGS